MRLKINTWLIIVSITFLLTELPTYSNTKLITKVQQDLLVLTELQDELALQAKPVKLYTRKIKFLAKRLNLLILFTLPAKCKQSSKSTILRIENTIKKLDNVRCKPSPGTSSGNIKTLSLPPNCLPSSILDNYLPQINVQIQDIKSVFLIDDNANNIPDICDEE